MSALFHHALSTPARFVGTVDATGDYCRPSARTLEQCRGMQRSSAAQIVPMGRPMDKEDRVVVVGSIVALLCLVVILALEWFA